MIGRETKDIQQNHIVQQSRNTEQLSIIVGLFDCFRSSYHFHYSWYGTIALFFVYLVFSNQTHLT